MSRSASDRSEWLTERWVAPQFAPGLASVASRVADSGAPSGPEQRGFDDGHVLDGLGQERIQKHDDKAPRRPSGFGSGGRRAGSEDASIGSQKPVIIRTGAFAR